MAINKELFLGLENTNTIWDYINSPNLARWRKIHLSTKLSELINNSVFSTDRDITGKIIRVRKSGDKQNNSKPPQIFFVEDKESADLILITSKEDLMLKRKVTKINTDQAWGRGICIHTIRDEEKEIWNYGYKITGVEFVGKNTVAKLSNKITLQSRVIR